MINIYVETKIYVLAPAGYKTGGTELLHQLVYKLNQFGYDAYIAYFGIKSGTACLNKSFKKYVKDYLQWEDIEDSEKNVLILPEMSIHRAIKFKHIRYAIWWLSVNNCESFFSIRYLKMAGLCKCIANIVQGRFFVSKKNLLHAELNMCQSYYAIQFLNELKIQNTTYLSDYLNDEFINNSISKTVFKENIVLYNPKKGYSFTKKIIQSSSDLNWIPLTNMSTEEICQNLMMGKVYIDFGSHPGKDRFPREAAICGCCIITGKKGSASFYEDVMIENKYKFSDTSDSIDDIIKMIRYCLSTYEECYKDFEKYRKAILDEEIRFENDIKRIFVKKGN